MERTRPKRNFLLYACLFSGTLLLAFFLVLRSLLLSLPSIDTLGDWSPNLVTKIYDINNELIDELYIEKRTPVPLSRIPVDLQNAVIAIEDTAFFKHWGADVQGIVRAAIQNILRRHIVQGGSTITQQLAKTLFLTPEKKYIRKIKEILLAIKLEINYTKEEILEMYLNQIHFGHDAYGVESAARRYFGKPLQELTLGECAMLAGLLRAPNRYSPYHDLAAAYTRRTLTLARMRKGGFITLAEEKDANDTPLALRKYEKSGKKAPYFVDWIRQQVESKYGTDTLYKGGIEIYTTLDIRMQESAENALLSHLSSFDEKRTHKTLAKGEEPEEGKKVQGGIVVIDPRTGQIRVMIGGRDFAESQFNRIVQAKRQPGSAFKPFIYTAAIDGGFTPASVIDDSPVAYYNDGVNWKLLSNTTDLADIAPEIVAKIDKEKLWIPQNYEETFEGNVLLRTALMKSINVCAVKVLDRIRPVTAAYYAEKMGITTRLEKTLSLALGSSEVLPIEIASAYCIFANQGIKTRPYGVIKIKDATGNTLEENFPEETDVLSPHTAYIMTRLLQEVCENGTGWYTKYLGRPRAGKTGTTNEFTDAWFIGFVPNLVCCVWVGYDDNTTLGKRKSGGVVAAPIWTDFMKKALEGTPVLDFTAPSDITFVRINSKTGLLTLDNSQDAVLEAFIKGTEPKEYEMR